MGTGANPDQDDSQVDEDLLFEIVFTMDTLGRAPVHPDRMPRWLSLLGSSVDQQQLIDALIGGGYVHREPKSDCLVGPMGAGRNFLNGFPNRPSTLATALRKENCAAAGSIAPDHTAAIFDCATPDDARVALMAAPFDLTADQAAYLLENLELRCLTSQYRSAAIKDASNEYQSRMPSNDPPPFPVGADQRVVCELTLLDEDPRSVGGPRAFVLLQPEVGRIEVGNPLPDHHIWGSMEGDLRCTVVEKLNGGMSGGGGLPWDDQQLDFLCSEPGTGTGPNGSAYIVLAQIPETIVEVRVEHDGVTRVQTPIRRTAAVPLDSHGSRHFTVFGRDATGSEVILFEPR